MTNLSATKSEELSERRSNEIRNQDAIRIEHIREVVAAMEDECKNALVKTSFFDNKVSCMYILFKASKIENHALEMVVKEAALAWQGLTYQDAPIEDFGAEFFDKLHKEVLEGDKYGYGSFV